jgi:hypothetical protein
VGTMPSLMAEPRVRLLIRIPASLKAKIAEVAQRERRSLNRQIEFLLDRALRGETKSDTSELPPSKRGSRHRM